MVYAENFLGDQQGATRRPFGRHEPCIEFMAVAGHESGEFTHGATPVRASMTGTHCATSRAAGCYLERKTGKGNICSLCL
jgi:hypothetical protein